MGNARLDARAAIRPAEEAQAAFLDSLLQKPGVICVATLRQPKLVRPEGQEIITISSTAVARLSETERTAASGFFTALNHRSPSRSVLTPDQRRLEYHHAAIVTKKGQRQADTFVAVDAAGNEFPLPRPMLLALTGLSGTQLPTPEDQRSALVLAATLNRLTMNVAAVTGGTDFLRPEIQTIVVYNPNVEAPADQPRTVALGDQFTELATVAKALQRSEAAKAARKRKDQAAIPTNTTAQEPLEGVDHNAVRDERRLQEEGRTPLIDSILSETTDDKGQARRKRQSTALRPARQGRTEAIPVESAALSALRPAILGTKSQRDEKSLATRPSRPTALRTAVTATSRIGEAKPIITKSPLVDAKIAASLPAEPADDLRIITDGKVDGKAVDIATLKGQSLIFEGMPLPGREITATYLVPKSVAGLRLFFQQLGFRFSPEIGLAIGPDRQITATDTRSSQAKQISLITVLIGPKGFHARQMAEICGVKKFGIVPIDPSALLSDRLRVLRTNWVDKILPPASPSVKRVLIGLSRVYRDDQPGTAAKSTLTISCPPPDLVELQRIYGADGIAKLQVALRDLLDVGTVIIKEIKSAAPNKKA